MRSGSSLGKELQKAVLLHSLGWLVAANLVGLWMALLLAKPDLGDATGAFAYGRWVPLHLNWQLYGWCSLPLVGMLFRHFLPEDDRALAQARWALWGWSLALVLGGLSWLAGETSGKVFLDWKGSALGFLAGAQALLWLVLASNWMRARGPGANRVKRLGDVLLLAGLACVPALLCWSASRKVYPPIDPGTGGPTGASLLGSTLGIVTVFLLAPSFLGRKYRSGIAAVAANGFYYLFSCAVYASINHHNSSHHEWSQWAGLGTLLGWIPLLSWLLSGYDWNRGSRLWLFSTLFWWSVLVLTGFTSFCPGVLDRIKFTHALVAHSHLAMAGLLSSFNFLVLSNLGPRWFARRIPFALWQGGLVLHLAILAALAYFEALEPGWLLRRESPAAFLFWARVFAGTLMATASVLWFWESTASKEGEAGQVFQSEAKTGGQRWLK